MEEGPLHAGGRSSAGGGPGGRLRAVDLGRGAVVIAIGVKVKLWGRVGVVEALAVSQATGVVIVTVAIDPRMRLRVPVDRVEVIG